MKSIIQSVLIYLCLFSLASCSSDDQLIYEDTRSFVTHDQVDLFINHDGTINLTVTADIYDGTPIGAIVNKGFVYSSSPNPQVSTTNTVDVRSQYNVATGYIQNVPMESYYYIRGYFEMSDGTYFYGDEVQVDANIDAQSIRKITLKMRESTYWQSATAMTVLVDVSDIRVEMPIIIGFEYSSHSDFSDSVQIPISSYNGNLGYEWYQQVIEELTSETTYYIRPYVIYRDGTITHGGNSIGVYTTSKEIR